MRWRDLAFYAAVMVLGLVLACTGVKAAGLQASFESARYECLQDDPLMVFCYDGTVDTSGNLIDWSGENLLTDRTEFDDWTQSGTCAVTADQWANPVDGTVDADLLDNTGGANTDHRHLYSASTTANTHTGSVWVRVDTAHNVTVVLNENGVGAVDTETVAATGNWQRVSVSGEGTGVGAIGLLLYPGESGTATGQAYFYGAQVVENDRYRQNMGAFRNPADQSVTKPAHDLAPTNSPGEAFAGLEYWGNRLPARSFVNASSEYYSVAHHASMNVFDGDHSLTMYVYSDDTSTDTIFCHSLEDNDGLWVYETSAQIRARYSKSGSSATPLNTNLAAGYWHLVQIVRDSDTATVYVNGNAGTGVDVSTFGIDGSRTMYVGAYNTPNSYWDGDIALMKLTAQALDSDQLADQRERVWGMGSGHGSVYSAWAFVRATIAVNFFQAGCAQAISSKLQDVAARVPRVGAGGILIENSATNRVLQASALGTTWTSTNLTSITSDGKADPKGTSIADGLVADANNLAHYVEQSVSMSATYYTISVYAAAGDFDWVRIHDSTSGEDGYFNVAEGRVGTLSTGGGIEPVCGDWYRVWISYTASAGSNAIRIQSAEDDGDDTFAGDASTVNTWFWNVQVETGLFPTSPIDTTTGQVTRAADNLTMEICDDQGSCVLPYDIGDSGEPDKLSFRLRVKCHYTDSGDIGLADMFAFSISGNTGTASATRNRVFLQFTNSGRVYFWVRDDGDNDHYAYSGIDPLDLSEWNEFQVFVDFADLSRMEMWMNGSSTGISYVGNSGTATLDLSDTKIRVGQNHLGTIGGNCWFDGVWMWTEEITP